jgi:amino acid adenylation domain-containing protein
VPQPAPGPVENIFDLTPLQSGLLFHKLLDEQSPQYVLQQVIDVEGPLDRTALRSALDALSRRHQALRTAIVVPPSTGIPRQVVLRDRTAEFAEIPLPDQADPDTGIAALAAADLARGFDLAKEPLCRVTLVPAGPNRAALIWSVHHIVVDGWSLPLLLADFARYYTLSADGLNPAALAAQAEAEAAQAPGFGGYLAWLSSLDPAAALAYWDEVLAGYDHAAEIPPLTPQPEPAGAAVATVTVPTAVTDALRAAGLDHGVTLPMWVATAWGLLLQRYTRSRDVVFGEVVSGRDADFPGLDQVVGLLINTLPVRVRTAPGQTAAELARSVHDAHLAATAAAHAPLHEIQRRHPAGQSLIRTLVAFENYAGADARPPLPPGLTMTPRSGREETSYPFNLRASLRPELTLDALYDPARYSAAEADLVLRRLVTLLAALAADPDRPADGLDVLDGAERDEVLKRFNATDLPPLPFATVNEAVEHWADRRPDQVAVTAGDGALTFAEFNARCNQLAHTLRGLGVGPGRFVALAARPGIGLPVGQYGIAKSGAAWVALDPDYPPDRVRFLVDDLGVAAVVTTGTGPLAGIDLPTVDLADPALAGADRSNPAPTAGPDDLVHCIYTSGTTGRPKAVLVRHRNLLNYTAHLAHVFRPGPGHVAAQVTSYTFDAQFWSHALGFLAGAAFHLVDTDALFDPARFRDDLARHGVTHVLTTPAHFREMDFPAGLEVICTGGAAATPDLVERALGFGPRLYCNAYGPTEITVACADWLLRPGEPIPPVIPIGRPVANTRCYVLDGLRVQGVGMVGELCVAGAGVTAGYHHRPELTAERFTANPFGPGRLYRTGDLAYWRPDGRLVCLGRTDDQVKVRGFRIEPAEIEAVLREVPGVRDAAVVARSNPAGEATLAAFYAPADVPVATVVAHCRETLPAYMVPTTTMALATLPRNLSGKVDAGALLDLAAPAPAGRAADPGLERTVAEAIGAALGLAAVPADADFFALGGDSISAIRVTTRLAAAGHPVTVRDLFLHRSAATLAAALADAADAGDDAGDGAHHAVTPLPARPPVQAPADPTPWPTAELRDLEAAMTTYDAALTQSPAGPPLPWTAPMRASHALGVLASYAVVPLPGPFDPARFATAWRRLLDEQELLRVTLDAVPATLTPRAVPATLPIPTAAVKDSEVAAAVAAIVQRLSPFPDPSALTGRLSHRLAVLVHESGATAVVPISHLVFDALSHDLLTARLTQLYRDPAAPAGPGVTYRDFAAFLARPPEADDATAVAGLGLEAFARLAASFAGPAGPRPTARTVAFPDPLTSEAQAEAADEALREALAALYGPGPLPVWGVTTGRAYRSANFAAALGEFLDLVPAVVDPSQPGVLTELARRSAFLRDHDLNVTALLHDDPAAARLPETAARLRAARSHAALPLVNAVILSTTSPAPPPADVPDTPPPAGGPPIITVTTTPTWLTVQANA